MARNAGRIMSFGRQNSDAPSLFDARGQRKYLCDSERRVFLAAANKADAPTRIFCHLLAYTGCRISEGLAVTPRHLDADGPRVIFRTLKRRKLIYRAVPIPTALFTDLWTLAKGHEPDATLWQWCRQTAWRHIHEIMQAASINGPQATPRGLRHGFCMTISPPTSFNDGRATLPPTPLRFTLTPAALRNEHLPTACGEMTQLSSNCHNTTSCKVLC